MKFLLLLFDSFFSGTTDSYFYLKLTELFQIGDLVPLLNCLADRTGLLVGLYGHWGFRLDRSILSGGDREFAPDGVF